MARIYKLEKCKYLTEFEFYLKKLEVDTESGGRKFKVHNKDTNETYHYSLNDIVFCYEKCVKTSIQNTERCNDIRADLDSIIALADKHVEDNGSMLCMRQFFGNLWFSITHGGFNKNEVLADIAASKIKGRLDITLENINEQDADGNTVLHRIILENKLSAKKLLREFTELLLNGIDLFLKNNDGNIYLDLAYQEALKNVQFPLKEFLAIKAIFFSQIAQMISRNYKTDAPDSIKKCLADEIFNRDETCVEVLRIMKEPEAEDFYKMFLKFYGKDKLDLEKKDRSGNNFHHYEAKYERV